jgi:hypothetical protein
MKRQTRDAFLAAAVLLLLAPAPLPAPSSTTVGVGDLDGSLNREFGVRADWTACCKVENGIVEIEQGRPIPAAVMVPARLAARGVPSPKAGDAVTITWQGGDRWLVRHEDSGKQFEWRWEIPPVKKKE